ncbi:Uncharacterized membrane protein YoaK, UPF0700 family [Rhizobium sp. RU20A]|uniref:YoaK family protein n=1 Tax=Rhizobium sp. RU20A TaxID=1907412 RepID=UPI000954FB5A|nr:YoaK family protein [Rhizobium sp. RU20A]SIQ89836.1 Uncharacterized membrane protein YoaK, UPF0700 family [Rhizobium sp. RU20A]
MHLYLLSLIDRDRSERADRHLAFFLAFVAGGINAGGFMAVHQYTSHMSGVVSSLADHLVLGEWALAFLGLASFIAFLAGAATSAILINWARQRDLRSQYAIPLLWQALLLAAFAGSSRFADVNLLGHAVLVIMLLCYVMGLQNAMITKLSGARIRTTHVTGMVTDIGIEIGKFVYRNGATATKPVIADRAKLLLLSTMVGHFFLGGICGAVLFASLGLAASFAFGLPLMVVGIFPLLADARAWSSGQKGD